MKEKLWHFILLQSRIQVTNFCFVLSWQIKKNSTETSLEIQWLKLHTSKAGAEVQSLVRALRYHKSHGTDQKKKLLPTLDVGDMEHLYSC